MIRKARNNDRPRISVLLNQISEQHVDLAPDRYQVSTDSFNREFIERYLHKDMAVALVVEEHNDVIAVALCSMYEHKSEGPVKAGMTCNLDTLVVDTNHQKQGHGRKLLEAAEKWARRKGCDRIKLNVAIENTGGIDFYRKCGYTESDIKFTKII